MTTVTTIREMADQAKTWFRRALWDEDEEVSMERHSSVSADIPRITITAPAFHRLKRYIDLCQTEIAGLGKMRRLEDGSIEIYDIFSLPQRATPGSAVIESEVIADYMFRMIERGEDTSELGVWWHSHVEMGASWSGIDTAMANTFQSAEYLVGILGNRRHDFICRLDIYRPFRIWSERLPLRCPDLEKIDDDIRKEIKSHLSGEGDWHEK